MVIKGNARGRPAALAKHLERQDTNERVTVREIRGVAADDVPGALKEMDALGAALQTDRTLYHASINVPIHEALTEAQRNRAIDRLEERLGLTGQPRVVVEHEKKGRQHTHVVWSRTDLEHMRAIRCDHNFRTHEMAARELEREFGHQRVQGVHVEREGPNGERVKRPKRTPSHEAMMQAERSGLTPENAKAWITTLWRATDSGKAFQAALESQGWILARGDRRDFVALDLGGGVHSLARLVEGVKAKDVRARMAGVDRANLPSVADARAQLRARAQERQAERPQPEKSETRAAQRPESRPAPQPVRSPSAPERTAKSGVGGAARGAGKLLDGAAKAAGSILDAIGNIFAPSADAKSAPQQKEAQPMPPAEPKPSDAAQREEQARAERVQQLVNKYGVAPSPEMERDADCDRGESATANGRTRATGGTAGGSGKRGRGEFKPAAHAVCRWFGNIIHHGGERWPSSGRGGQGRGNFRPHHTRRRAHARRHVSGGAGEMHAIRDDALGGLLMSIAEDVERQAGAVADAIRHEFAIKMDDARRHMPRHQVASALRGLADARSAALTAAASKAAAEMHGRQQAALAVKARRPDHAQDSSVLAAPSPG